MHEYGIHPSAISGTSAGAIAGAFLACGFSPDEIREMVDRSSEGCYLYIEPKTLHGYGMFDTGKLAEIFEVGYQYTTEFLTKKKCPSPTN